MKFLSVCSGIEAASVAWRPLGWEAVAFSEIEPFPCAVLKSHYPDTPNLGDMTKFSEWPDYAIDLLCGGTPCQSFSVAGLRKGLADPRGNLMLTFGAIAAKYLPKWVVWENVPGVLSSNGGRDFGTFLGMLGQLGYGFAYRVLDAQYFGVAQRRRRVFVVGCLGDWRAAAAVLFERHSLSGYPAPSRQAGKGFAGTIAGGARKRGGYSTDDIPVVAHSLRAQSQSAHDDSKETYVAHAPELARCIATREGSSQDWETTTMIAHSLRGEGFDASEDGTGRGTPIVPVAFGGQMSVPQVDFDLSQTLQAKNPTAVAFVQNSRDEVRLMGGDGQIVGALAAETGAKQQCYVARSAAYTTKLHNTAANNAGKVYAEYSTCLDANSPPPALLTAMQVRRLTPRECERLQGFPDDYTAITYRGKPAADGPRYKALGNSWAVPCARWIGERIQAVEAIHRARAAA